VIQNFKLINIKNLNYNIYELDFEAENIFNFKECAAEQEHVVDKLIREETNINTININQKENLNDNLEINKQTNSKQGIIEEFKDTNNKMIYIVGNSKIVPIKLRLSLLTLNNPIYKTSKRSGLINLLKDRLEFINDELSDIENIIKDYSPVNHNYIYKLFTFKC